MTADLAGELDRLDKAATPGPWEQEATWALGPRRASDLARGLARLISADVPYDGADGLCGSNIELIVWLRNHTDEIKAALAGPAPCEMTRTAPFDFAQCETHDTTFALGEVCKFHNRDPFEVLYEEADEQRGLKVRAEAERDDLGNLAAEYKRRADQAESEVQKLRTMTADRDAAQAEVERLRAAVARVEALAETWRRKAGRGVWLLDHAAADISTALAGDDDGGQECLCDGGSYQVVEHPFIVHPDCPIHGGDHR